MAYTVWFKDGWGGVNRYVDWGKKEAEFAKPRATAHAKRLVKEGAVQAEVRFGNDAIERFDRSERGEPVSVPAVRRPVSSGKREEDGNRQPERVEKGQ